MKRIYMTVALVIGAALVAAIINGLTGTDVAATPPSTTPPGTLPITEEPVTLTGFIPSRGFIVDISTNAAMKHVTARTNVQFDWIESSKPAARDELGLLLAGEEYPGIIQGASGSGLSREDLVRYGSDGVFLPLNDLIDEYGHHTKELFATVPGLRAAITAPDGNIYGLPAVFTDDYHMTMRQKLWINQEWLDRLDLETPATTEEFFQVMAAFRDRDANGNGDPTDEIPMTGARRSLEDLSMWIMNAFVPAGGPDESGEVHLNSYEFIVENRVVFTANTERFRSGLRYIRSLYAAGLINVDTFTQDRIQVRPLIEGGDASRVGAFAAHHPGNFTTIGDDPALRFRQYTALPPIEGPDGTRGTPWLTDAFIEQGQFVITDSVHSPEIAFRLADYYYSREFAEVDKGIEGVHWRRTQEEEELPAIGGGTARYEYLKTITPEDNAQVNLGPVWSRDLKLEFARSPEFSYEQMLFDATLLYEPYKVAVYPYSVVSIPSGSIDEFNDLRRTIHTYVGESVDRFIIGGLDIETDWSEYVQHLNRLGLPRYLEMMHAAHVRLQRRSGSE
jgi:putative aldouronate transport system substrate-binding protein